MEKRQRELRSAWVLDKLKGMRESDIQTTFIRIGLPDAYRGPSKGSSKHHRLRGAISKAEQLGMLDALSEALSSPLKSSGRNPVMAASEIASSGAEARRGEEGQQTVKSGSGALPNAPIFVVHGSDTTRAESVARTLERATGCNAIILREQANVGRTLIEKFEQHAQEVSYAVILLSGDDRGCRSKEEATRPRARQNVIFEMGYFYGLIGRRNVSVLIDPEIEKPSDMEGIAYITYDEAGAWKNELFRELRDAGFNITL